MRVSSKQQGFVSILTVLFFMTLISIITVGFTRFMLQEQRQQLEDELSKSAYNAALVGVEDAKRAISYCFSLAGPSRTACEAELYRTTCPGFNTQNTFSPIGIPASASGRTSITNESSTTAPQGYSCVIIGNSGSVSGNLNSMLGTGGRMYELATNGVAYDSVRLSWHSGSAPHYPVADFNAGNLRLPDWVEARYPAVLRVGIITIPDGSNFNMSNIQYSSTFLYPTSGSPAGTETDINAAAPLKRYAVNCDAASSSAYDCSARLTTGAYQPNTRRYLVLNSIYRNTEFDIAAYSGTNFVPFVGVQYYIDSTGYTSGLSRRARVNVSPGDRVLTIPNAIDSGLSFCKDFRVGADASLFQNNIQDYCTPEL